jgi:hypothetical protein
VLSVENKVVAIRALFGQMFVKPLLQLRLFLPVAQETLPVTPEQLFRTSAGTTFTHSIQIKNPGDEVTEQEIRSLAVTVTNAKLSQQLE